MRTAARPPVRRYEELVRDRDLTDVAERAFGREGLGIAVVTGVPDIAESRQELFVLGRRCSPPPVVFLNRAISRDVLVCKMHWYSTRGVDYCIANCNCYLRDNCHPWFWLYDARACVKTGCHVLSCLSLSPAYSSVNRAGCQEMLSRRFC